MVETFVESHSPCYASLICLLEVNRLAQFATSNPRNLFVCFRNNQIWGKDSLPEEMRSSHLN